MSTENKRVCKRCLLRDISSEDYLEHLKIYIEGIEDSKRTPEELYEERLRKCSECEFLRDGLCAKCGCFVEYRAAIRRKGCPKHESAW